MVRAPDAAPGSGRLEAIHLAPSAGEPMESETHATALAGKGLAGDRYATGAGHWSPMRRSGEGLTLIEGEVMDELRARHGLRAGETRRNLTTRGIRLNDLVGRRFRIGQVECRGTRVCEPCSYLDGLQGTGLLPDLVHRGGIRAEIMTGGIIAIGDSVEAIPV